MEKRADPKAVIRLYTKDRLSLRMIAGIVGVTMQRVHQILVAHRIKMRPRFITRHARKYSGRVAAIGKGKK